MTTTEIAYLKSRFVRVVQIGESLFEVQTKRFRGEGKVGKNPIWKTLYGVYDRDLAIRLLESYA